MKEVYNQSVYEIFGGLKKKWPTVRVFLFISVIFNRKCRICLRFLEFL